MKTSTIKTAENIMNVVYTIGFIFAMTITVCNYFGVFNYLK